MHVLDLLNTYLLIRLNGKLVWVTAYDGMVVVGILPPTVPGEGKGRADVGEVEDLTLVVLGRRVDEELQGTFQVEFSWRRGRRIRSK